MISTILFFTALVSLLLPLLALLVFIGGAYEKNVEIQSNCKLAVTYVWGFLGVAISSLLFFATAVAHYLGW